MADDLYCWRLLHEAICKGEDSSLPVSARTRAAVDALEALILTQRPPDFLTRFLATNADINVIRAARDLVAHSISVVAGIARSTGMTQEEAHDHAYEWIAHLQGALMLLASTDDSRFVSGVLQRLSDLANGLGN